MGTNGKIYTKTKIGKNQKQIISNLHSMVTCHLSPGGQAGLGHCAVLPQFPAAASAEPRGRGGVRAVHVARVDEGGDGVELLPEDVLLITAQ